MFVVFIRGQSAATEGCGATAAGSRCMDFLFRNLKPGPHTQVGRERVYTLRYYRDCLKVLAMRKDHILLI